MYIMQFGDAERFAKYGTTNLHQHIGKYKAKAKSESQIPNPYHQVPYCEKSMVLIFYLNTRSLLNKKSVYAAPLDFVVRGITADYC